MNTYECPRCSGHFTSYYWDKETSDYCGVSINSITRIDEAFKSIRSFGTRFYICPKCNKKSNARSITRIECLDLDW